MTREQRLAAAEELTDVLARTTGSAEHPTGLARATATATGGLKSLDLHPDAVKRGPEAVGRLVVETARLATDAAVQTSYNELAKSLGDSMAMAVEAFAGPPPLRTAAPPTPGTPPAGPRQAATPAYPTAAQGRPVAPAATAHQPVPGRAAAPQHPAQPPAQPPAPAHRGAAQPPAPPWAGQQRTRPAPRPEPAEDDDDDFFADPFRGQRQ